MENIFPAYFHELFSLNNHLEKFVQTSSNKNFFDYFSAAPTTSTSSITSTNLQMSESSNSRSPSAVKNIETQPPPSHNGLADENVILPQLRLSSTAPKKSQPLSLFSNFERSEDILTDDLDDDLHTKSSSRHNPNTSVHDNSSNDQSQSESCNNMMLTDTFEGSFDSERVSFGNLDGFFQKCTTSTDGFSPLLQGLAALPEVERHLLVEECAKNLKKFSSYLECNTEQCQLDNLREHFHCYDGYCYGRVLNKKEEIIRHLKWHKKRKESLKSGFLRFSSCDDCSIQFGKCPHNHKQTHYHCIQGNCDKVYVSTSDVQMHSNYHRKDSAIIQEGFQRFRATEECNTDACHFSGQRTTHFHCIRSNCQFYFKNKADMEKHKSFHIKDEQLARDGFKKFLKADACGYVNCRFSQVCNHIHCTRENCSYVLHSSGQLISHKRKHERHDSETAYRRYKMVQRRSGVESTSDTNDSKVNDLSLKLSPMNLSFLQRLYEPQLYKPTESNDDDTEDDCEKQMTSCKNVNVQEAETKISKTSTSILKHVPTILTRKQEDDIEKGTNQVVRAAGTYFPTNSGIKENSIQETVTSGSLQDVPTDLTKSIKDDDDDDGDDDEVEPQDLTKHQQDIFMSNLMKLHTATSLGLADSFLNPQLPNLASTPFPFLPIHPFFNWLLTAGGMPSGFMPPTAVSTPIPPTIEPTKPDNNYIENQLMRNYKRKNNEDLLTLASTSDGSANLNKIKKRTKKQSLTIIDSSPLKTVKDDHQIPTGYSKFRFNEDCKFVKCGYRNHQSHFHCCRPDCFYSFCDKTRFVQHTVRHERLDKLMGDDFKQYRANMHCGHDHCIYNKNLGPHNKSSHFHCLKCDYICSDTNKVVAHRRQHSKQEHIRMAGFRKVSNNEKCNSVDFNSSKGECCYSCKQTHYHCLQCDGSVLSRAQLKAHQHLIQ